MTTLFPTKVGSNMMRAEEIVYFANIYLLRSINIDTLKSCRISIINHDPFISFRHLFPCCKYSAQLASLLLSQFLKNYTGNK